MALIYYHQTLNPDTGAVMDQHFIDTSLPWVLACFTAIKADATKIAAGGWDHPAIHPLANPGETKYQFFVRRLNAIPGADPIKALGLV